VDKGKRKIFHLVSIEENCVIRHSHDGKDQIKNATNAINFDTKR